VAEFQHFLLTRFNVKIGFGGEERAAPDLEWLEHRFRLFDDFCFPSVRAQTNQDFKWLVFFDVDTPQSVKERLASYAAWENFTPCYLEYYSTQKLSRAISDHIDDRAGHLITTRVDNDDALGVDYVQTVQNSFAAQDLEFINIVNGYIFFENKLYSTRHPSNTFISLIEKADDPKTVYCQRHGVLSSVGSVRQIETEPLWLQVLHERNALPRLVGVSPRVPLKRLDGRFVLDHRQLPESESLLALYSENAFKTLLSPLHKARRFLDKRLPPRR
jgi:hypothetical protein